MCRKTTSKDGFLARLTGRYPASSFYVILIGAIISVIWGLTILYAHVPAARPFIFLLKTPYRLTVWVYRETKVMQETDDLDERCHQILHKSRPTRADSLFLRDYPKQLEKIRLENF